jgi:hypothetical protein
MYPKGSTTMAFTEAQLLSVAESKRLGNPQDVLGKAAQLAGNPTTVEPS